MTCRGDFSPMKRIPIFQTFQWNSYCPITFYASKGIFELPLQNTFQWNNWNCRFSIPGIPKISKISNHHRNSDRVERLHTLALGLTTCIPGAVIRPHKKECGPANAQSVGPSQKALDALGFLQSPLGVRTGFARRTANPARQDQPPRRPLAQIGRAGCRSLPVLGQRPTRFAKNPKNPEGLHHVV